MRRVFRSVATIGLLTLGLAGGASGQSGSDCRPEGGLAKLEGLPEASGLAISRRSPGRLWAHNDSGEPVIFAVSASGAVSRVRLTGVAVDDWEAIAVGDCPGGSCVYIGDIGDNNGRRKQITVYRLAEPAGGDGSVQVKDIFHATYPDGAHDAETLLVSPDGTLYIVTKGETGGVSLYRFPKELRPGATHKLERVGKPRDSNKVAEDRRITDGTLSADGKWVALRSKTRVWIYPASEFLSGSWSGAREIDVTSLGEPQGEGIAMSADGTIYLAGEGGGKSQPGTLARLSCGKIASKPSH